MCCLVTLAATERVRGDVSLSFCSLPVEMPRLIGEVVSSTVSVFAAVFGWRSCRAAAELAIAGSFFPKP